MIFSIITIVYNAADLIEETMRSVLDQNYPEIEYIIIDGSSNDGTQVKIEKLLPAFIRKGIKTIYSSEPDKGISDAFNKGIRKASGDIIVLINAGDCLLPGALEKVADAWAEDDEIVYGKTLAIDKKNNLRYLREIPCNLDLSKMVYNGLVFTHQSAFVKKTVYDKYGLYDENIKYIMDSFLFIHFYQMGVHFRYLDEVLVSMLYGGISSKPSKGMLQEKIKLSEKYHGYSKKTIIFNHYKKIPIFYCKSIIRKFPWLWMKVIGKKRLVPDNDY